MKNGTIISIALAMTLASGCLDARRYSVAEGDACRFSSECQPGLVCVGQACVEAPTLDRDASGDDVRIPGRDTGGPGDVDRDLPPAPDVVEDVVVPPDTTPDVPPDVPVPPPICEPGERDCATNFTIRICNPEGDGFDSESCAEGTWCQGGVCVEREDCEDRDGDGFRAGPDCSDELDCNDDNATVFPGAREDCADFLDNDCDGQVDEGARTLFQDADGDRFGNPNRPLRVCDNEPAPSGFVTNGRDCDDRNGDINPNAAETCNRRDDNCNRQVDEGGVCDNCSEGSCPRGQICVDGDCREAPEDQCRFQNQPCNPFETPGNDQYACVSFEEDEDGLCFGLCEYFDERADESCPDSGSICAFQVDDDLGFCLRACDAATNTGCFEGQGCIAIGDGGGCIPVGDTPQGERCDDFEGPFGQCEAGLACVEFGFGPECRQLCNPLREARGLARVCSDDEACQAFDPDFGLCVEGLGLEEGDECRRFEVGTPCADDIICTRIGRRETQCTRMCRLDNDDDDCINGGRCQRSDFMDEFEGLGICR